MNQTAHPIRGRKIAVFTGTRAEYGLLYWLMREIQDEPELELQLIVSGSHLSELHGLTVENIEADGFNIDYRLDLQITENDSGRDIAQATARATHSVAEALEALKPDILVLLGDRYELLGAATAALLMGVPIFHLHGGEVTEGANDDAIRHSITKMAAWHGVAAEPYGQRVIQMGEQPDRVFNVGAMGLDNIAKLSLMNRDKLEASLDFELGEKNLLVTYHPVTTLQNPDGASDEGFDHLLGALNRFPDVHIIFTYPNADSGRTRLVEKLEDFIGSNSHRCKAWQSLGQLRYLSLLKYVDGVVGNSSSGIIEAPAFCTGTVNIGSRQKGRLRAESVIDCEPEAEAIFSALSRLFSSEFKEKIKGVNHPYGNAGAAKKICQILVQLDIEKANTKPFYDLENRG